MTVGGSKYKPEHLLELAVELRTAVERAKEAGFSVGDAVPETLERTATASEMTAQGHLGGAGETVPVEVGEAAVDRVRSALVALNARLGLS